MTAFTPLRVRSHGSLLEGLASPEALIERALETGLDALALTDRDNLYLAVRFMNAASAEGLKPLTGALISHGGHEALLLAADRRGYARLCALLTRRHLDPRFDLPTALGGPADGLHVIVESPGLAAALIAAGVPPACAEAGPFALRSRGAGAPGLWMGVRGIGAESTRLARRIDGARALGVPLIATGDVVMIAPRDHEAHRVAVTAAHGELIERMTPAAFAAADAWFAAPAEWARRVNVVCARAGRPEAAAEALAHNAALVTRCRLKLEMGTPIFPRAPLSDGESGEAKLRRLALDGAAWRYRAAGETARARANARLDQELGVIAHMGFTDYFLLVAEIVGFARDHAIPTVGRGSGASSIVAYVLGITNVDPIRYGLHFERFLNPSRRDCPDLDIDLCWKRRDEVIEHVYRAYGADRVAMISTHATLGARSAFRETAKALGVPNARVNQLARRIPRELEPPYAQRLAGIAAARGVDWSEPVLARALALAERLSGAPRHLSVHSGGIVIADRELTHYVPLERAAKDVVVTQFEMRAIEAIGLVKMDLLGNRALTTIGDCIALARGGAGGDGGGARGAVDSGAGGDDGGDASEVPPELDAIPEDDARTGERVAAGDTLNCFQLESPAMRHLLRMLRAATLPDTILGVALVRPGPAGSPGGEGRDRSTKETFCRRQRGLEPATFLHPSLEPVLRSTHGLMLYEEDVMRVAAAFAGLTLAQGDDLRRAIAHARGDEEFRSLERGFVAHAVRLGADDACAHAVWRELTRFAAYAFCHAHAAGYGTLGWQSAYLKTRFPTEWAVGVLNHHAGMYPTWVHVEDLRRHGVEFRGPCVARSEIDTTLERGERSVAPHDAARSAEAPRNRTQRNDAVRVGLSRVAGLSAATAERMVAARRSRPFASLQDVLERTRPDAGEIEALILSGALDVLGRTRPSLLLEARVSAARAPAGGAARRAQEREPALVLAGGSSLLPDPVAPVAAPELPEFDISERVRGEMSSTGLWFSAHPLDVFADAAAERAATPAAALSAYAGRRVTLVGMLCAWRRVETKSGGVMLFATLADRSGLAECALFPAVYREFAEAMNASIVRIEGRVDETLDSVTVAVERVAGAALNPSAFPRPHGS
jgi:DNA-directed DNA polymerase III PolC